MATRSTSHASSYNKKDFERATTVPRSHQVDLFVECYLTSRWKILHSRVDVIIKHEGLHNISLSFELII